MLYVHCSAAVLKPWKSAFLVRLNYQKLTCSSLKQHVYCLWCWVCFTSLKPLNAAQMELMNISTVTNFSIVRRQRRHIFTAVAHLGLRGSYVQMYLSSQLAHQCMLGSRCLQLFSASASVLVLLFQCYLSHVYHHEASPEHHGKVSF